MPACFSASFSDLYESCRSTYLPTKATSTSCFGFSCDSTILRQDERSAARARIESLADDLVQHLVVQHHRDLVDRVHVPGRDHRLLLHVAEKRYLAPFFLGQRLDRAAKDA